MPLDDLTIAVLNELSDLAVHVLSPSLNSPPSNAQNSSPMHRIRPGMQQLAPQDLRHGRRTLRSRLCVLAGRS